MNWRVPALLLLAVLGGCTGDTGPQEAMRTFASFQAALRAQDEAGCRETLTIESAQALAQMPWQDVAARPALTILGAERDQNEFRIEVADPNDGDRRSEFVVVREYGRLVVDLVASAGLTARFTEATASPEQFTPRELTPGDFDRIREHELAQPPR